jgi:exodeoxyribonuclease (lambda-induced)
VIKVKCEQNSDEWRGIKAGVASPSNFDRLITASMKPSSQDTDYLYELAGEYVHGYCKEIPQTYWVRRGTNLEPQARLTYELIHGDVEQVGFVYKDKKKLVGCSPDGLMPKKGLEIKCPEPINHTAYLLAGVCPKKYLPQVQGSMWITGKTEWDFMSYNPGEEPLIVTVKALPEWQRAIEQIVPPFLERLEELLQSKRVQDMRSIRLEREAA